MTNEQVGNAMFVGGWIVLGVVAVAVIMQNQYNKGRTAAYTEITGDLNELKNELNLKWKEESKKEAE